MPIHLLGWWVGSRPAPLPTRRFCCTCRRRPRPRLLLLLEQQLLQAGHLLTQRGHLLLVRRHVLGMRLLLLQDELG
jgi:hypothetical protein